MGLNIAVFGGSFDPPHVGHVCIINAALRCLDIDLLYVVVSPLNPFKVENRFSPIDRFNWMKKITSSKAIVPFGLDKVVCSDFELNRGVSTPTVVTVDHYASTLNPSKIYLLLGKDNLGGLSSWFDFKRLSSMVDFVVFERSGFDLPAPSHALWGNSFNLKFVDLECDISSTKIVSDIVRFKRYIPSEIADEVERGILPLPSLRRGV